ncbi:MAG: STING domain-containing protein [Bacteroidales bacterium]|nr:STING domain-containing protein [Bacteroidales bacterium]
MTDWQSLINGIVDNITVQFNKSEIQLLPSTSLAIGYFHSFIYNVARFIFENDGCYLNKRKSHHRDVEFKIILPNELSDDISAKAKKLF